MKNLLKQLLSFILPITVLVVVPVWVEKNFSVHSILYLCLGFVLVLPGLVLMAITISSFIRIGKGTLAPWAPPKKLVISGPYKYVRNPMILGVLTVLIGEAISVQSKNIFVWAICFFIINTIYFIIYEEPNLESRFGGDYREYKKNVSRWWPRFTPYHQNQTQSA